jgi:hypothetical protein
MYNTYDSIEPVYQYSISMAFIFQKFLVGLESVEFKLPSIGNLTQKLSLRNCTTYELRFRFL